MGRGHQPGLAVEHQLGKCSGYRRGRESAGFSNPGTNNSPFLHRKLNETVVACAEELRAQLVAKIAI